MSNSRKDPVMVEAVRRLRELLTQVADAAVIARREYEANPRWNGYVLEGLSDDGKVWNRGTGYSYPCLPYWVRAWTDEGTGLSGHTRADFERSHLVTIDGFIRGFRNGLTPSYIQNETPRRYLDRVRSILRYEGFLDDRSAVSKAFALLRIVRDGRPYVDPYESMKTVQDWKWVPISKMELLALPGVLGLRDAMVAAFDHASVSLIPRRLSMRHHEFLTWLIERGGSCRTSELIAWINEDKTGGRGAPSSGQGMERTLLRTFCDKPGGKMSRTAWVIRPEAQLLYEGSL